MLQAVDLNILDAKLSTVCLTESTQSLYLHLYKTADASPCLQAQRPEMMVGHYCDPPDEMSPKVDPGTSNIRCIDGTNIYTGTPTAEPTNCEHRQFYTDHNEEFCGSDAIVQPINDSVADKTCFLPSRPKEICLDLEGVIKEQPAASYDHISHDDDILPLDTDRPDTENSDYVQYDTITSPIHSYVVTDYEGPERVIDVCFEDTDQERIWHWNQTNVV